MNCRRCTTQVPSRSSSCPNCGQHVGAGESFIDDPGESGVEGVSAEDDLMGTSLVDAQNGADDVAEDVDAEGEEDELSLDDAVVSPKVSAPPKSVVSPKVSAPSKSVVSPKVSAPSKSVVSPKVIVPPKSVVKVVTSIPGTRRKGGAAKSKAASVSSHIESKHSGRSTLSKQVRPVASAPTTKSSPSLPFDVDTVRTLLAEQPELIEPGLEILVDDTGGEIGVRHPTDVGVIDLLTRDASGGLVAVFVHGPDAGANVVAEALQLVGWVRKHLAKDGEDVRGIVLCEGLDEDAAYTAAAVSGTIAFKSYALSLSVNDLDV